MRLHTRADVFEQFHLLIEQYGPLVRVGPNTVITSSADVFHTTSAARSAYSRADFYYAMRFDPGQDHIFSTLDEGRHEEKRRKMAAGYSGKENVGLEKDVDGCVLELVSLIEEKYASSRRDVKPLDLARKVAFFTTDVMSKLSFDQKFNDLRDDGDNYCYIVELEKLFSSLTWTAVVPGFLKLMTNIGLLQKMAAAGEGDGSKGLVKVKKLAFEQVAKRFGADGKPKGEKKKDMLGSFIKHGLTMKAAQQEAMLNM